MGFLEDFWANINAGATTIATAPDPIINIGQPRKKPTPTPTPTTTPTPTPTTTSGGNTPANTRRSDQQIYDLIETYHGDDISLLHAHAESLGDAQRKAKLQRDETAETVHSLHLDQEGRISENAQAIATHGHDYAGIDHTHNGGGGECEFWDLGCHFGKSMEGLGKLALIGVVAFFIFMLIKKRLKI